MEAKRIRWIAVLFCILSFEVIHASVVILKNGDIYTGTLKTEKPDSYVFNSRFGELSVVKSDVENIIWSEKSIKLQEFKVDKKTLKGRVVRNTDKETAFLTEDGKIVRVKKQAAKAAPKKPPAPKKLLPFYVGLAPTAGISQVRTIRFNEGAIAPDTVSGPNTFGVQLDLGYQLLGELLAARLEFGFNMTQHKSTASGPPPGNAPPDAADNEFDGKFTQTKQTAALDAQFFFNRVYLDRQNILAGMYVTVGGGLAFTQTEMKVNSFGALDDIDANWKGSTAFPFVQGSVGWMIPIGSRFAIDIAGGVQYEFLQTPYDKFKLPGDISTEQEPAGQDLQESLAVAQDNPIHLYMRVGAAYRF